MGKHDHPGQQSQRGSSSQPEDDPDVQKHQTELQKITIIRRKNSPLEMTERAKGRTSLRERVNRHSHTHHTHHLTHHLEQRASFPPRLSSVMTILSPCSHTCLVKSARDTFHPVSGSDWTKKITWGDLFVPRGHIRICAFKLKNSIKMFDSTFQAAGSSFERFPCSSCSATCLCR